MFQYTNTIILNSNLDSSGKPKWTAQAEAAEEHPAKKGSLNVKRVMKFIKEGFFAL